MSEIEIFNNFEGDIRRVWDEKTQQNWFAVVDVIELLTDTKNSRQYLYDLKRREGEELSEIILQFHMKHKTNGRIYQTDCANQEGMLRIIQSIPSPKAEPFKRWLAMTGNRRLDEIAADPVEAERERLRLLGFSEIEIERQLARFTVHQKLESQWKQREISDPEAEVMTDTIHKGTFDGMSRQDHKELKGAEPNEPIYDHMTPTELAFSILGEATTLEDVEENDPQGFEENLESAERGGKVAGELREVYEEKIGRKVISEKSPLIERRKQIAPQSEQDKDD